MVYLYSAIKMMHGPIIIIKFLGLIYLRLEGERQFGTCYRFLVTFLKEAHELLFYKIDSI